MRMKIMFGRAAASAALAVVAKANTTRSERIVLSFPIED